jgi:predicted MPP superfamily phosphohydrolase
MENAAGAARDEGVNALALHDIKQAIMFRSMLKLIGILLSLLLVYCWWIEPRRLTITEHEVADPEKRLQEPIRVLLLTDWHLGRFSRPAALQAKMERLQGKHGKEPFDLVLLGGDYVDIEPNYLRLLLPVLETLAGFGVPVYAVLGNHDYTSFGGDAAPVIACLEKSGVQVLRNSAAAAVVRGQKMLIVGLDDLQESPAYYDPNRYLPPAHYKDAAAKMDWYAKFDAVEPETPRIVLAHNPDAAYLPGRTPLAVLCGHTHGGQIMLLDWVSRPLHRWIHPHLPPGSAVTWAGRRTINGRMLIVSRGMEGSAVPLRLLRSPEAVVIVLH